MLFPWFGLTLLAWESNSVIGLRLMKLAGGGAAAASEAELMISEKVDAALEAAASLWCGTPPSAVVDRYREHVAPNALRLCLPA